MSVHLGGASLRQRWQARGAYQFFIVSLLLALVLLLGVSVVRSQTIPTFSIQSVTPGQSVTIRTSNFPANQNFTVTMGRRGTQGIGGIVVTTTNSGAGGSFTATYTIPAELRGQQQIAIRLQSPQGYFSYNWFHNVTAPAPQPGVPHTGIPTISIQSVTPDQNVTIVSHNYPANQNFTVTMGRIGTRGVGGIVVATTSSGGGGSFTATYNIPAELRGQQQIAIRLQSPQGFFSYNWFHNRAAGPPPGAPPPPPGFVGIPTFRICSVARNQSVTIQTNNFPANQTFNVTMGPMGTRGVGGASVGTLASGSGGTLTATFNIPAHLHNSNRIAIRAQTGHANPFFAYNWFSNTTANVCP